MGIVKKTTTHHGTWLGRPGTVVTYHFDGNRFGKRIAVHVWDDAKDVAEMHALKGSFWHGPKPHTFEKTWAFNNDSLLASVKAMAERNGF